MPTCTLRGDDVGKVEEDVEIEELDVERPTGHMQIDIYHIINVLLMMIYIYIRLVVEAKNFMEENKTEMSLKLTYRRSDELSGTSQH